MAAFFKKGCILAFLIIHNVYAAFDMTNAGCYFDIDGKKCIQCITYVYRNSHNYTQFLIFKVSDPTFFVATGKLATPSPYFCYLDCLRQAIIKPGKPIVIGLTEGDMCLCGHESSKLRLSVKRFFSL